MRKKTLFGLTALNALLALALFTAPALSQMTVSALRDCCEGTGEDAFCCANCCWFVNDCDFSSDCTL